MSVSHSPSLVPTLSLQRTGTHHLEHSPHIALRSLRVRQDVSALLRVHACNTIPANVSAATGQGDAHRADTHSKLLCNLSAIGASGVTIVSHAFCTSTSRMALRDTRLSVDFEPSVATSQTVATPYLRLVRTSGMSAMHQQLVRTRPDACETR